MHKFEWHKLTIHNILPDEAYVTIRNFGVFVKREYIVNLRNDITEFVQDECPSAVVDWKGFSMNDIDAVKFQLRWG